MKQFRRKRVTPEHLRQVASRLFGAEPASDLMYAAADRIEELERLDSEAANYVESVICMRTDFTGYPPYTGWKGLGLALKEALDERDRLRAQLEAKAA